MANEKKKTTLTMLELIQAGDVIELVMVRPFRITQGVEHLLHILSADGLDPLKRLREMTVEELTAVPGVGLAKATVILAAVELGKRVFLAKPEKRTVVDDPNVAVEALSQDLMWQSQERFAVVLLDVKHRLLGTHVVSIGTATETLAHPRDVFRVAIRRDATRIIIAHNHPSGSVEPSPEDLALTRQFLEAASVLGVPVLDHLILGSGQYCSLRQTTNLWQEHPQG
jgi:DNA repair protein RadC